MVSWITKHAANPHQHIVATQPGALIGKRVAPIESESSPYVSKWPEAKWGQAIS